MKTLKNILGYEEKIEKITSYRSAWMGIAILWIVWCHSGIFSTNTHVNWIKWIGYGGVDVFVFCAGIGAYYSLMKDSDAARYLKRRVFRIMPTYWCFLLAWVPWHSYFNEMPIRAVIGNVLCVQDFTHKGNSFNWYMSAIWFFYLLAPVFKSIVEKINNRIQFILWLLCLVLFSVPFWTSNTLIITVIRIPIFFAGMYWCKRSMEGCMMTLRGVIGVLLAVVVGVSSLFYASQNYSSFLWSHGLYWYPFLLLAPGLCICWTYIIRKIKVLTNVLNFMGNYSFEIYLVHVLLFEVYRKLIEKQMVVESKLGWMSVIAISLVGSLGLRVVVDTGKKCVGKISACKEEK